MSNVVIGITGGIGSGKSTVAKVFQCLGYPVYNSDEKAKSAYFNPEVKSAVIDLLGKQAYLNEESIDRKYISDRVFSETALLTRLNAVIHPAVMKDFEQWKLAQHTSFVLKESALLFETGLYKNCNRTILVSAPEDIRTERVMKRDGVSRAEVEKRMKNQLPEEKKFMMADFVIDNSGSELVIPKIMEIADALKDLR